MDKQNRWGLVCRIAASSNKRINADGGDALFFYPSSVAAAGYAKRSWRLRRQEEIWGHLTNYFQKIKFPLIGQ